MSEDKYNEYSDRQILIKAYEHALSAKKNSNALLWIVIVSSIIAVIF